MDDNTLATSEDTSSVEAPDTQLDTSVETQVEAPERVEKREELKPPKSTREALEQAFEKAEDKTKEVQEPTAPEPKDAKDGDEPEAPKPSEPPAPKGPQSWKADVRQKFEALPPDVKSEITRRESQIEKTLRDTATERKIAQDFMQMSSSYTAMYKSRGIHPMQAASQLMNADYTMQTGTQAQKAEMLGRLIKNYGVDLVALDSHLAGIAPKQEPQGASPEVMARLQRAEEYMQHQQQQQVQSQQNSVNTDIEKFAADPKNEFFQDVAPQMIALLQGGSAETLKDAYDQAAYANPNVRKVLIQRDAAVKAKLAAGNTSLGTKGPRNGNQSAPPRFKNTRDALEAAFAAVEGGRV